MSSEALYAQFIDATGPAERLRSVLSQQIESLLNREGATLGVPLESRVKSWASISEKLERKSLALKDLTELDDLVGLRLIMLFRTDLQRVDHLLTTTFDVVRSEDTSTRLGENQFGYQSRHYVLKLPDHWMNVPSFAGLGQFKAEIQVRTLAQHIWAAASHKLQYKHEATVPPPLRRSISRVSALLETVDLEFERLLSERQQYLNEKHNATSPSEKLNVDLVEAILTELLPPGNQKEGDEDYAALLEDLSHFGVETVQDLRTLLEKNMTEVLHAEHERLQEAIEDGDDLGTSRERSAAGVFFTHVGLTRIAISSEFGEERLIEWFDQYTNSDM